MSLNKGHVFETFQLQITKDMLGLGLHFLLFLFSTCHCLWPLTLVVNYNNAQQQKVIFEETRLALASVLGPFGTFAEIHSTHPGALMHYSRLEFHFKV